MKIFQHLKREWIRYGFETLAVVIGILAALALDNWNEVRKDRNLEIEILTEIKENLIQDFKDHNENISYLNHVVRSSWIILDHLNNDLPYQDSLASHFSWLPMAANFDAINSGYELWLSAGVDIITNDSMRIKINSIYGQQYNWLRDFLKDRQYLNNHPLFMDMMKKFKTFELLNRAIPRNYEELKDDDDFKVLVQQNASIINSTLWMYENILDNTSRLIEDLEYEIERLSDR